LYAITASDRLGNDRKNNFWGTILVSTWTFLFRQLLLASTVTPVGCGLSYVVVCRHYISKNYNSTSWWEKET